MLTYIDFGVAIFFYSFFGEGFLGFGFFWGGGDGDVHRIQQEINYNMMEFQVFFGVLEGRELCRWVSNYSFTTHHGPWEGVFSSFPRRHYAWEVLAEVGSNDGWKIYPALPPLSPLYFFHSSPQLRIFLSASLQDI